MVYHPAAERIGEKAPRTAKPNPIKAMQNAQTLVPKRCIKVFTTLLPPIEE
jgi:hypothetical protein